MLGSSVGKFQIPNLDGEQPRSILRSTASGLPTRRSTRISASDAVRRVELAALGRSLERADFLHRTLFELDLHTGLVGRLVVHGHRAGRVQAERRLCGSERCLLRVRRQPYAAGGVFLQSDHSISDTISQVLQTDDPTGDRDVPSASSTTAPRPSGCTARTCRRVEG